MRFAAARFDAMTLALTAAFVLLISAVTIASSIAARRPVVAVLYLGAGVVALVLAYGLAPAGYVLSDRSLLVVRRLFGTIRFAITAVTPVDQGFGIGGLRLMGSGGVFGWYGFFWRPRFGRYRAYVTHRRHLLSCSGPNGPILISPANPTAFLAAAAGL
jgi:hypothetical protein